MRECDVPGCRPVCEPMCRSWFQPLNAKANKTLDEMKHTLAQRAARTSVTGLGSSFSSSGCWGAAAGLDSAASAPDGTLHTVSLGLKTMEAEPVREVEPDTSFETRLEVPSCASPQAVLRDNTASHCSREGMFPKFVKSSRGFSGSASHVRGQVGNDTLAGPTAGATGSGANTGTAMEAGRPSPVHRAC